MDDQTIRLVWFGMMLLHGLGHGGALAALAWLAARPGADTGAWTEARSWLFPSLHPQTALVVASGYWAVALVGFVSAAMMFWFGIGDWEPVAIVSALVSLAGLMAFFGTWPLFNAIAALAVNAIVLGALVLLGWAPPA